MEYYGDLCMPSDSMLTGISDPYAAEFVPSAEYQAPFVVPPGEAEYEARRSVLVDGADRFGVSAVVFDKYEELVWMGNQGMGYGPGKAMNMLAEIYVNIGHCRQCYVGLRNLGHVTSYYGSEMQKYTSFQVHESEEVRCITTIEQGILALTKSTLRQQIRRGLPTHTHKSANMVDMQCLLQLSPTRLLVGGHQEKLIDLDLNTMTETLIEVESGGCAVMSSGGGGLVALGGAPGGVCLRDARAPSRPLATLQPHSAALSDLALQGDTLLTAGFHHTSDGVTAEPYVVVWDVRKLRGGGVGAGGAGEDACWTVPLPVAPLLLHFLPAVSGRACAVSAQGHVFLFHVNGSEEPAAFQVDAASEICVFDISATSQAMAFGDQAGHLQLYSARHNTHPLYNMKSRSTEFADASDAPHAPFSDAEFKYSSVPRAPLATGDKWFHEMPACFDKKVYRKPKPIDPEVLKTMKMQGPIGYAPNPRTCRRNEMPYIEDTLEDLKRKEEDKWTHNIPKRYLKMEVRYSKHGAGSAAGEGLQNGGGGGGAGGVSRAGLEATMANSYCNAMLQLMYYTAPLKAVLLAHTCAKEFCLTCELGFLFRMLDTSGGGGGGGGAPCQASNFLRAFRTVPEAAALGLILPDRGPGAAAHHPAHLIQSWNRFILHQMHTEIHESRRRDREMALVARNSPTKSCKMAARLAGCDARDHADVISPNDAVPADPGGDSDPELGMETEQTEISELFGIVRRQVNTCLKCENEEERSSVVLACALAYPAAGAGAGAEVRDAGDGREGRGFVSLLRAALASTRTTPAWCTRCDKFAPTRLHTRLHRLPPILSVNCGGVTPHERAYWTKHSHKDDSSAPETPSRVSIPNPPPPLPAIGKPCRYGLHCSRPTCRFKHPQRQQPAQSPTAAASRPSVTSQDGDCVIPHALCIRLGVDGDVDVTDDGVERCTRSSEDGVTLKEEYTLYGVVACVEDSPKHLVAFVRIEDEGEPQWYLFNDTSISAVDAEEAVQFGPWWKTPCVLLYCSRAAVARIAAPAPPPPHGGVGEVFSVDDVRRPQHTAPHAFTPLAPHEMPTRGMIVGIDAEFVTLNTEEVELRSDGQRSTVRPSHMAVARISCVRGEGPLEGVPFMDDYISTQEQVVDYLTKFSGIKPGDLDAKYSDKHLTTLKSSYQKLRYLVDAGVVFVGHGLNNDFRVINLVVPAAQVVDTVQLFHLPHHRMLSLKFLAYHFLGGAQIQSETHDSVEDARTALRLRRCYLELSARGQLRPALAQLYRAGQLARWKVPSADGDDASAEPADARS